MGDDTYFVCVCASQRAGATKEELSHRYCQEEAGGRVCRRFSHIRETTQIFVACWIIFDSFMNQLSSFCLTTSFPFHFPFLYPPPPPCLSPLALLQVLLMQESVRRIIEAEESKMGKGTHTHPHTHREYAASSKNFAKIQV